MGKIGKALIIVLCVCLMGTMGYMYTRYRSMRAADNDRISEIQRQEKVITDEIYKLEAEIEKSLKSVKVTNEKGNLVMAFLLASKEDADRVYTMKDTFAFSPVLIVDPSMDSDTLHEIMTVIADMECEVMLKVSNFTSFQKDKVSFWMKMKRMGTNCIDTDIVVLSYNYESAETRTYLEEMGLHGIVVYKDSSGVSSSTNGVPYLGYSEIVIKGSSKIKSRIADLEKYRNELVIIYNFEQQEYDDTAFRTNLKYLNSQIAKGNIEYCKIADAAAQILANEKAYEEAMEGLQVEIDEKQARIDELKAQLKALYQNQN